MKLLERGGHFGHECGLADRPRTTNTKGTESWLPCNGEVVEIASLDITFGAIHRGGVAGKHPIGVTPRAAPSPPITRRALLRQAMLNLAYGDADLSVAALL